MKLKLLATSIAPGHYTIDGETITAHVGDQSEAYDLSEMPEGATLTEVDEIAGVRPIRAATRVNGELQVTLCQRVGAGHWSESDWMEAEDYDPDAIHVQLNTERAFAGTPTAYTRQGATTPEVV